MTQVKCKNCGKLLIDNIHPETEFFSALIQCKDCGVTTHASFEIKVEEEER